MRHSELHVLAVIDQTYGGLNFEPVFLMSGLAAPYCTQYCMKAQLIPYYIYDIVYKTQMLHVFVYRKKFLCFYLHYKVCYKFAKMYTCVNNKLWTMIGELLHQRKTGI